TPCQAGTPYPRRVQKQEHFGQALPCFLLKNLPVLIDSSRSPVKHQPPQCGRTRENCQDKKYGCHSAAPDCCQPTAARTTGLRWANMSMASPAMFMSKLSGINPQPTNMASPSSAQ